LWFFFTPATCSQETALRNCQNSYQCTAILSYSTGIPDININRIDGSNRNDILIPFLEISGANFRTLSSMQTIPQTGYYLMENLTFILTDIEESAYLEMCESGGAKTIVSLIIIIGILILGLNSYKYYCFYKLDKGFKFSLVQCNLILTGIANFLIMLSGADPANTQGVYPSSFNTILIYLPIFIGYISTASIIFYWQKSLVGYNHADRLSKYLTKFKIPIIVVIGIVIIIGLIFMILRTLFLLNLPAILNLIGITDTIVSFIIAPIFIYYGIKLIRILDKTDVNTRIHYYVSIFGVTIILKALLYLYTAIYASQVVNLYVYGNILSWFFTQLFEYISNFSLLITFIA